MKLSATLAGASSPPPLVSVTVEIALGSDHELADRAAQLTARSLDEHRTTSQRIPLRSDRTARSVLRLAAGSSWQLALHGPTLWAPVREIVADDGDVVRFEPRPAGALEGQVAVARGDDRPQQLTATLAEEAEALTAAAVARRQRFEIKCPVASDGRFACQGPAGRHELRLSSGRHVPHYRWGIQVPAGGSLDLGRFRLVAGSSVVGWVRMPQGSASSPEEAKVRLRPLLAAGGPEAAELHVRQGEDLELMSPSVRPDARGFFQLTGVAPGTYSLEAAAPGLGTERRSPLEVLADTEMHLSSPLDLEPPGTIQVFLDPPLAPDGSPWRLSLVDPENRLHERRSTHADLGGAWTVGGLATGIYHLVVESGDDRISSSRWHVRPVEVGSGDNTFFVDLALLRVEGRLRLGDEPLRANLWFGGRERAVSLHTESNDEGEFRILLPHPGLWAIDLSFDGHGTVQSLEPQSIEPGPGRGVARVDLEVPATLLEGRVVDGEGRGIEGAQVLGVSTEEGRKTLTAQSGESGRFTYRGLAPGALSLQAIAPEGTSHWRGLTILEEGEVGPVELVLLRQRTVRGRVTAGGEGIPGVWLQAQPTRDGAVDVASTLTAGDGSFELRLAEDTTLVDLKVLPPAHGLRLARVALGPGDLEIALSPKVGELVLDPGPRPDAGLALFRDGIRLPLGVARRWLASLGLHDPKPLAELRLPRVEAGTYALCDFAAMDEEDRRSFLADLLPGSCVGGSLAAGGRLRLALGPGSGAAGTADSDQGDSP